MTNTCDTCKWWGLNALNPPGDEYGERICSHPKLDSRAYGHDCLMQVGNDAGWVENWTGPRFGCCHHESGDGAAPAA